MSYSVFPRIHSLYGRFLGVTPEGYVTGANGVMEVVTALTSASTGTKVPASGLNTFNVTTGASTASGSVFVIDYPRPGVTVTLANAATTGSTANIAIVSTAGNFLSGTFTIASTTTAGTAIATVGSTYNAVTLSQPGNTVVLEGISTAYYLVRSIGGFTTAATALLSTY